MGIFGGLPVGSSDNSDNLHLQQTQLLDYCRAESHAAADRF